MWGRRTLPVLLLSLAAAHAGGASVQSMDRYVTSAHGVVLEITVPRDDIVRVRAGRGELGEDASWAVPAPVRGRRQPFSLTSTGSGIELRTRALSVRVDPVRLRVTVLDAGGRMVLEDAPGEALELDAPGSAAQTGASAHGAMRLRKRMPTDAHYFGLGDKAGPLDRRDEAFTLWNTDAGGFQESTDPLYKSIPFVIGVLEAGSSFGFFVDTTWRSTFDFGRTERDTLRVGADGGAVDYYVLGGPTPKRVVEAYAYLTGTAPLIPLWALGFQQSRYSYATEAEARGIANRLRSEHFPADVLYLDIDYQDRNRPFTVSPSSFPDMPRFLADMQALDFKVVLITDLHVAAAPEQGYAPYDTGMAQDVFLKRPDGKPYVAEVWPGASVFPDFSRATVRDWWGALYAGFVRDGAAGFWNDMNEPAIFGVRDKTMPLDTVHRIEEPGFASREASHAELHNVYGMQNSRATFEGLRRLAPQRRPFVLTRATYAGGQRYAATWTGDNTSSWNHWHLSIPMLTNLGLSGFGYAGDDIGGFEGAGPSPDLLTRWIEIGAFNPIFRDHAAKGKPAQEPWVDGAEHAAIRRRFIEERYHLMPYLYALAEENSRTGLPLMRPVFLEFPSQLGQPGRLGGTADEFMLGPDLLIAPPPVGESPAAYPITLPGPGWYDYWTGERLETAVRSELPRLDRLPVYVRPGSIIPLQPVMQSTARPPEGALQLAVYPGPDCAGQLYFDDGVSIAYQAGVYLRQSVRCSAERAGVSVEFLNRTGTYRPWWRQIDVDIHGFRGEPRRVRLNGREVAHHYDASTAVLRVSLPDVPGAARLLVDAGSLH